MKLVFLDVETGGVDATADPLVEIGWAVGNGPIGSFVVPHDPSLVKPEAAAVNGYYERGLNDPTKWATQSDIEYLRIVLTDATIVGANPAFDAASLKHWLYPDAPWAYRMLDIEAMAYQAGIRHPRNGGVPGLANIRDAMIKFGYPVPEPDHTAVGDVVTARVIFEILSAWTELYTPYREPTTLAAARG